MARLWPLYREAGLSARMFSVARLAVCPLFEIARAVPPGARVFDIGCGRGFFLAVLAKSRAPTALTGCDVNREAIATAQAMGRALHAVSTEPALELILAETDRGWPAGPFTVVSMIDVMHHMPPAEQRGLFAAAARRVAPGGLLIYKDMALKPAWKAAVNQLHDLVVSRQWIHCVPVAAVEQWASEEGLNLIQAKDFSRLGHAHELRVFQRGT